MTARADASIEEGVEAALDRLDSVEPQINAFTFVAREQARAEARELDSRLAAGGEPRLLEGVPVAIKSLTPVEGWPWEMGSVAHRGRIADRSAVMVERLRAAGAVVIGLTTTPEFAHSSFGYSPVSGVTRNPWDLERTPGGSSSGAGAAVAAGVVPLAEGSDMGGSIRIPASWSGVVGLKPSFGRIPFECLPNVWDTLRHHGPVARTVDDAWRFLAATAGPDDRDPFSLPAAPPPRPTPDVRGLRIGVSPDLGFYFIDPEVRAAVEAAASDLEASGAHVEPADLGWSAAIVDGWLDVWHAAFAGQIGWLADEYAGSADPALLAKIEHGRTLSAAHLAGLDLIRTDQWRRLTAFFADHDALLCATMSLTAPRVDADEAAFDSDRSDGLCHTLDLCCPFNWTPQCPVVSVPVGWSREGLPIGMQIVTPRYRDDMALGIARALEEARPWADRVPPVWAT
jgi:Asp-tRNA(Asn)/Glu-tRNA(Gln) amidotransferase A subunit family amidase